MPRSRAGAARTVAMDLRASMTRMPHTTLTADAGAPSCSSDKEAKAKAACRKVPFVRDPAPSAFGRHTPAWVGGEIPSGPNADVWRLSPRRLTL